MSSLFLILIKGYKRRCNARAYTCKNLALFVDDETKEMLLKTITYKKTSGSRAKGVPAQLLTKICEYGSR